MSKYISKTLILRVPIIIIVAITEQTTVSSSNLYDLIHYFLLLPVKIFTVVLAERKCLLLSIKSRPEVRTLRPTGRALYVLSVKHVAMWLSERLVNPVNTSYT